MIEAELLEDIDFLLNRASHAGCCDFTSGRDCGISSNALVWFAYTGERPDKSKYPSDGDDLTSCKLAVRALPLHRASADVYQLLGDYEKD